MSEEAYTNPKKIILTYLSGILKLFVVINQETPTEIFIFRLHFVSPNFLIYM